MMNHDSESVVYLMRHGAPEGGTRFRGVTDDPLSAEGFAQMRRAAAGCGEPDRIVTSPLRRCASFARVLAEERGLSLVIEPRFREMHFGTWEGKTPTALMAECPGAVRRFWSDPQAYPPPGGEPPGAFCSRVAAGWRELVASLCGERVLLIAHGGTVRAILGHLRRLPMRELTALEVPYASVHRVDVKRGGVMVRHEVVETAVE